MDVLPVKYSQARKVTSFLLPLSCHTFLSPHQSYLLLCHIFTGAKVEPQPKGAWQGGESGFGCGAEQGPVWELHWLLLCTEMVGALVLWQQRVPLTVLRKAVTNAFLALGLG